MTEDANADELSIFVSSTLKAIASGVANAQKTQISSPHGTGNFGFSAPKDVEFDVAVSAKQSETGGVGLKVSVFGIGANAGGQLAGESSTISRIRFSVPTNFKQNPAATPSIPSTKMVAGK